MAVSIGIGITSPKQDARSNYDPLICIHHYEGAWNANTGNGYYGGLQMNWGFMRAYGAEFLRRWGTADRWPPWAQMMAGHRAVRTRGYSPWPTTRRYCGV